MELKKHTSRKGFNITGTVFNGRIIDSSPTTDGKIRFLVATDYEHEIFEMLLTNDEIANVITGDIVDRATEKRND